MLTHLRRLALGLVLAAAAGLPASAQTTPAATSQPTSQKVLVFDFELVNTSLEGEVNGTSAAEQARLARLTDKVRTLYGNVPQFKVVQAPDVIAKAHDVNLQSCGGCDVPLAKDAGADLSVTGVVQKVSNLILSFTIYVHSASTGQLVAEYATDIRGNTDESWDHGIVWLAEHRMGLLPEKKSK